MKQLTAMAVLGVVMITPVLLVTQCSTRTSPLPTEAHVDAKRYMGRWYEIFRLPNSFQSDGKPATADYTFQENGTIRVLNTEYLSNDKTKVASGIATPVPESGNARLRVKFEGLASLAPNPEEGNYWIIKVEPDYSVALVGTPDRKFLWFLSRTPHPPAALKQRYLEEAQRQGFAIDRILTTDWTGWKLIPPHQ